MPVVFELFRKHGGFSEGSISLGINVVFELFRKPGVSTGGSITPDPLIIYINSTRVNRNTVI